MRTVIIEASRRLVVCLDGTWNQVAEAFRKESAPGKTLQEFATTIRLFPDALMEYAQLGRSISQIIAENGASQSTTRTTPKVRRNDP